MDFSLQLGITAGVLQLVAFGLYNRRVFQGKVVPNTATWLMWSFLTVVGCLSYAVITDDVAKYLLPAASACATICTCIYATYAGKFKPIEIVDWIVIAFGVIAVLVWWAYQSATYAYLIITLADSLAFIPLYRALWRDPTLEKPLAWYVWASAYSMLSLVVLLRWDGNYAELVGPLCMLVLHAGVGLMTLRKSHPSNTTLLA